MDSVFTGIAKYVIRKNGIVFGAVLSDELYVCHTGVDIEDELVRVRNSKYVQSYVGGFNEVKPF